MRIFLCFLVLSSSFAHAISETDYAAVYQTSVVPFYQSGRFGEFSGREGVRLSYVVFANPAARASVVIAPGYNESHRKYAEVAYDLFHQGYSVYVLDHRGQGLSARLLEGEPNKGHIDHFERFAMDLKVFVDRFVPKSRPRYLLAHSMGGAIAARYLERYPKDFRAAALSAPMLEIDLGRDENLAYVQLLALITIGRAHAYATGTGYYDPASLTFEGALTQSRARFENNRALLVNHPELFLGGQSVQWVFQGLSGSLRARREAARAVAPVLILQAGLDALVKPGGQEEFCSRAKACRLRKIPQARHEILQEIDAIRGAALDEVTAFFRAN